MMARLTLETFVPLPEAARDTLIDAAAMQAACDKAYAAGMQAGADAATAAFAAEKIRLLTPIAAQTQALCDAQTSARAEIMTSFRPILDMLLEKFLPDLAHHTLRAQIGACVNAALKKSGPQILTLSVAPENIDPLRRILPDALNMVAHADMDPLQAHLHWSAGYDDINVDEMLTTLQALCAQFFAHIEPQTQEVAHVG